MSLYSNQVPGLKPKPILVQDKQCNSETSSLAGETDAPPKSGILKSQDSGINRSTRGGSVKLTFGRRPMIKKRVTLRWVFISLLLVTNVSITNTLVPLSNTVTISHCILVNAVSFTNWNSHISPLARLIKTVNPYPLATLFLMIAFIKRGKRPRNHKLTSLNLQNTIFTDLIQIKLHISPFNFWCTVINN